MGRSSAPLAGGVGGVVGVGELAGVEVVDEGARALVSALPAAVHDAGGIEARLGQRAKGAYKGEMSGE